MRRQREKGYWLKRSERFQDKGKAKTRASSLRGEEHTSHVCVEHGADATFVTYSIARWYVDAMKDAGVTL